MTGLRVFVTGGGRGIGRAIALRFARGGGQVVVAARSTDELERVAGEVEDLGGRGLAAAMDVRSYDQVAAALERALAFTGGALDVLVNNAGVFAIPPFEEMDLETWRLQIDVNLTGPFHVTRAALWGLRRGERPHVINVSSVAGRQPFPGGAAYCASKYGLRGFGDALRLDLAASGIRVSTVYPGATDTAIFEGVPGDWDRSTMNRPEDVAEAVWRAYHAPASADVDDIEIPPPVTSG